MKNIGVQLYSFSGVELSISEKIRHAAKFGYDGVEFADDYDGMTAPELRALLRENGLWAKTAHVRLDRIGQEIPFLAELGVSHVIYPHCDFPDVDKVKRVAERLNELGKYGKAYGIKVGFHNHYDEFFVLDGQTIMDRLIELTDPETVSFQLDCGWAACAGITPEEYLTAHAGRFSSVHIKENAGVILPCAARKTGEPYVISDGRMLTEEEAEARWTVIKNANVKMGTGNVNWRAVIKAALAQNLETTFVVERENAYADRGKEVCIAEDLAWLRENL